MCKGPAWREPTRSPWERRPPGGGASAVPSLGLVLGGLMPPVPLGKISLAAPGTLGPRGPRGCRVRNHFQMTSAIDLNQGLGSNGGPERGMRARGSSVTPIHSPGCWGSPLKVRELSVFAQRYQRGCPRSVNEAAMHTWWGSGGWEANPNQGEGPSWWGGWTRTDVLGGSGGAGSRETGASGGGG